MKWNKMMKFAVAAAVLLFSVFAYAAPSLQAVPAKTPTVSSHTYKKIKELKYPQVHHIGNAAFEKNINQELKAYIEQSYQEYLKNKKAGEQQGFNAEYQTSFSVKYNAAGKLSIQTLNYIYSGGAHGLTSVQSFNYDLKTQKRVTLNQILNTKTKVSKTKDYLYSYIKKHDTLFFPDVKKEDITLNQDTTFYFTKNGIAIVFGQYDLGPYAAGIRDVQVPSSIYQ
ncbi:DUF3298 and DUF4163 domain-containing protein [Bacillus halotolerans]|uniref:DUF3298 and DUF4163 domain-containing protein n=1 Tax=Bacillus halotolerans TaxID=260554 RepID=UPI00192D9AC1|nr:DUF3298 and DUF4163 domain-containing protein [Bacillus halotolerans]MBL6009143.1 DUF3298 and DUF4163 domain-containing protein [Bacillus halotolerans]